MKNKITLIAATMCLLACGACTNYVKHPAKLAETKVGSKIIAKVSNSVVDKGLAKVADKLDGGKTVTATNPYLHSIAVGLRAQEGQLITQEKIQEIAVTYGDPNNTNKMKRLAADIWGEVKSATWKIGRSAALELVAGALNNPEPTKAPPETKKETRVKPQMFFAQTVEIVKPTPTPTPAPIRRGPRPGATPYKYKWAAN